MLRKMLIYLHLLGVTSDLQLYIPLPFWFCRNPGLALPIIALQYSDTVLKINIAQFKV